MKRFQTGGRLGALVAVTLALSACGLVNKPTPPTARDWQGETIYFALTDRFSNGDPSNDNGADREPGDRADRTNPLGWHGGDWKGLQQKIESGYFKKLGFTAIWISPVVLQVPSIAVKDGPNKGKPFAAYHGYWADDFFKTDPHFGSQADLKALVDSAHKNGLKIIQDVVVNHAGYKSALTDAHPDWFHTQKQCDDSTNKDQDCGLDGLPDFDQSKPEVVQYLNDFVTYWRDNVGIDGLRIDTMKHVADSYWPQFFKAGGAGDPSKIWSVGEVFNGDPAFLARYMDVLGSPSVFDFALYFAVKDNLSSASGSLDALADTFARDSAYKDPTRLTTFIDNHDVPRFVSEVQNKGGNAQQAAARLDLALSLMYMSRGTPSVYQGTEIAQAGKGDPYNYVLGEGNREDMDFSKVDGSPTAARLTALAKARTGYVALRHGVQQELWRPNGGAPIYAFRRVMKDGSGQPVVAVMNNGDTDLQLSSLPGGGIPLLGTFSGAALTEITGRTSTLKYQNGLLVGTVPAHSLLAVSGKAGSGATVTVNPALPEVGALAARAGDGAVQLTWTAPAGTDVTGYRVYQSVAGGQEQLLNFAPLPASTLTFLARSLTNGSSYSFRVVGVDAQGRESAGRSVSAMPDSKNTVQVTFTVNARSQGNGTVELRRFDTGSQISYPMTQTTRGLWKTTVALPLFRTVEFKFGNTAAGAKNSGYEGPNQPNRSVTVDTGAAVNATYDYISTPAPTTVIEGHVTGKGAPLAGALVEGNDKNLQYAYTFADGSYTLLAPSGSQTLTASAAGYLNSAAITATSPATGVDFALSQSGSTNTKYTIDGNLSDWIAPKVKLTSPDQGGFGTDNNFLTLQADSDSQYLYLAYTYTVSGNSAIVYLDTGAGGALQANQFAAWPRLATFNSGVDSFVARYGNEAAQVHRVTSNTVVPEVGSADYLQAASGTLPNQTVELAIPWTALGLSGKPSTPVNIYGGIFGGDNYGAGDIVPNSTSTPPGANTTNSADSFRANFTTPLTLP
ncbi:alpha-amylase family glycosyl hydrolase [Deinococcus sonorensis]|uniref:Alpha-amylase family glycosyl hydrolase n=2 Tax=Deinococcus sonorensis TaxID=309891 RepID=A0AAU7UD28_9DEIO